MMDNIPWQVAIPLALGLMVTYILQVRHANKKKAKELRK